MFGQIIKSRRIELHMTQAVLAAAIHTSQATISRIEADAQVPGPLLLMRLASVLHLDPAGLLHLLSRTGGRTGPPDHTSSAAACAAAVPIPDLALLFST